MGGTWEETVALLVGSVQLPHVALVQRPQVPCLHEIAHPPERQSCKKKVQPGYTEEQKKKKRTNRVHLGPK